MDSDLINTFSSVIEFSFYALNNCMGKNWPITAENVRPVDSQRAFDKLIVRPQY